jgi:hypothetical protein
MDASLQIIDRFRPRRRRQQQAAVDAGRLVLRAEASLLEPPLLRPLSLLNLILFFMALLIFSALDLLALSHRGEGALWPGGGALLWLWLAANLLAYILVLPLHELLHGLAFSFWGGRPYYGARLPLALYCGARGQLFPRNYYLVVGLTPFVVITLAALGITLLYPRLASYLLLAAAGHSAGSAGDLLVAYLLLRHHAAQHYVEDSATGFRVWEIRPPAGASP